MAGEIAFTGVSIDSRTIPPGALFVAVRGPRFDGHDFLAEAAGRGARAALVQRDAEAPAGLPLVRVADTTKGLADLARHVRREAALPVVAVTGSVGKTTTKDMTAHLLATRGPVLKTEGNLNNQYGLPLTLLRLAPEHTAAVLELGMSAPGEIRALSALAEPDVATITRIAPVHLEFFPSVDAIAEAKAEILEGLRPGGTAVLNGDDPRVRAIGERFSGRVVWFGRDRRFEVSAENERVDARGQRAGLPRGSPADERDRPALRAGRTRHRLLPARRRPVRRRGAPARSGPHFVTSFLAAAAAAHVLGVPIEAMAEAATSLRPARHRGEVRRLGERRGAARRLLQLLARGPRGRGRGPLAPPRPRGASPCSATCWSSGRAERRSTASGAAPSPGAWTRWWASAPWPRRSWRARGKPASPPARSTTSRRQRRRSRRSTRLVRPGDAVLVKASRGVRLEAVVDALAARFGEGEA